MVASVPMSWTTVEREKKMKALGIIGGWMLLAGGLLGAALHAFLYFEGHYRQSAESSAQIGRQLAGSAPNPERDAAEVSNRIRGDLIRGCVAAGIATLAGAGLLAAVGRRKPHFIAAAIGIAVVLSVSGFLLVREPGASAADAPQTQPTSSRPQPPPVFKGKTAEEWGRQLNGTDAKDRFAAAEILANIGPSALPALEALIVALKDPNRDVRHNAAIALGHLGPKAAPAVPALIEALKDKDFVVLFRAAVAEALGEIGPQAKPAVPALVEALKEDHPFVRGRVGTALKKLDPEVAAASGVK
jgi:hypothetical protein